MTPEEFRELHKGCGTECWWCYPRDKDHRIVAHRDPGRQDNHHYTLLEPMWEDA